MHGLIGENGSGKSTFVKVVAGIHRPDFGEVTLDGEPLTSADRPSQDRMGIACVHQDSSLIDELTVGQNLDLIVEPAMRGSSALWCRRLLDEFGLSEVRLGDRVSEIRSNEKRLVEIAAVLARKPRVVFFDESTSSLDERGVALVLQRMRDAAAGGACVIFVTHRLHEALAVTSEISVLRDGVLVAKLATAEVSADELVRHMAGREVSAFAGREAAAADTDVTLRATALRAHHCGPIDMYVHRGEIVGIGGAAGNGQGELIRALAGEGILGGEVSVLGRSLRHPEDGTSVGAVFVSADRHNESLSALLSVRENYTLALRATNGHWWNWIPRRREVSEATELADRYDLARTSIEQQVSSLSGGNQQKVSIGRAVARRPQVLVIEEPTEGVDVRSRFDLYRSLVEAADSGTAVVFTSSDASELRLLADRVLVIARGRQVAELRDGQVTEEAIVHAFSTAAEHDPAHGRESGQAGPSTSGGRRLRSPRLRQLTWSPATFMLLVLLLGALGVYGALRDQRFATMENVSSILELSLPLALVAMAQMPVLLVGEIDASLGSMMGLVVVLLSFGAHASVPLLFGLALAAGIVLSLVNAVLVAALRINSVNAAPARHRVRRRRPDRGTRRGGAGRPDRGRRSGGGFRLYPALHRGAGHRRFPAHGRARFSAGMPPRRAFRSGDRGHHAVHQPAQRRISDCRGDTYRTGPDHRDRTARRAAHDIHEPCRGAASPSLL